MTKYKPILDTDTGDWTADIANSEKNLEHLQKLSKEAREKGTFLHSYFAEPVADGKAFYQVVKIDGDKCTVQLCDGICLDDYVHDYFGYIKEIDLEYAQSKVKGMGALAKIFS